MSNLIILYIAMLGISSDSAISPRYVCMYTIASYRLYSTIFIFANNVMYMYKYVAIQYSIRLSVGIIITLCYG